jgi:hypothetical protein
MATVALTTAGVLDVVEWPPPLDAQTLRCAADLAAGTFVRQDASGNWIQALATTAPNLLGARFLLRTAKTGEAATAIRKGTVAGLAISQAFNVSLFVGDTGVLADAAGTVSQIAGRVIPGTANLVTNAQDKLFAVDLPE